VWRWLLQRSLLAVQPESWFNGRTEGVPQGKVMGSKRREKGTAELAPWQRVHAWGELFPGSCWGSSLSMCVCM